MGRYLLGLDSGSTVCKAILCDLDGREVGAAQCKIGIDWPQPGWAERDVEVLWQCTAQAIRDLLAETRIDPAQIAVIGCTGHGNGVYLLDRTGQPLRPGILSVDNRAAALLERWQQELQGDLFPHIYQQFYAGQTAPLLAWLKAHERGIYDRIGTVLLCKDAINYFLTGEIATDFTDMSTTALLDVAEKCYSPALWERYGIPEIRAALPQVARSAAIVGGVSAGAAAQTGLAAGTPVVAGMIDIVACAIGSGVVRAGQGCVITGTWSINEAVTADPITAPNLFLTMPFADPALWMTVEASATSATNLEWFVTQFCVEERLEAERRGISVYEVCSERVASVAAAASTVIFHPFLFGSTDVGGALGGFYGINGWHTRAHLLRAIYEGVAFGHRDHVEKLHRAGVQVDTVRLTGGGARSPVLAQIFADVLDVTVEVPDSVETGAKGAALTAGIGAGIYANYEDAAARAVRVQRIHRPDPAGQTVYAERYAVYRHLLEAMREPWRSLSHNHLA